MDVLTIGVMLSLMFWAGGFCLIMAGGILVDMVKAVFKYRRLGVLRWKEFGFVPVLVAINLAGVVGFAAFRGVGGGWGGGAVLMAVVGAGLFVAYVAGANAFVERTPLFFVQGELWGVGYGVHYPPADVAVRDAASPDA